MIQINLINQGAGRRRRADRPAGSALTPPPGDTGSAGGVLVFVCAAAMLALNAGVGWAVYHHWKLAADRYTTVKRQRDEIKSRIADRLKDAEQLRRYREVINNQMDVLRTLDPPDRLLWSQKLNMLADLMPPDVFLSAIEVNEQVTMVETEESIAAREKWEKADPKTRGKQPEVVKKPVLQYVLRLTGLAVGDDNVSQFNNALRFHQAMIDYQTTDAQGHVLRFMDGFEPDVDFESVEATTYEGQPVNKFIFRLKTVPVPSDMWRGRVADRPAAPARGSVVAARGAAATNTSRGSR